MREGRVTKKDHSYFKACFRRTIITIIYTLVPIQIVLLIYLYMLGIQIYLTDYPWLALGGVGPRGRRIFFLTSTRWLPMYENQNPATISRQKCYQMYLWPFQTSKMNFLPNDPIFYRNVPKVVYWWVEKHITRSVSGHWCLQSYWVMTPYMGYQCLN